MYPNINSASVHINMIQHGKIKKIALVRKVKIYEIINIMVEEYLSKEENIKVIENFDKAFYKI